MNKLIFVDSNIFIEALKKNFEEKAVHILNEIFTDLENDYFINEIIFSEVYFHLIVKEKIKKEKKEEELFEMLNLFSFLESKKEIIEIARNYIVNSKLRTNDALILATTKFYNISYLISFDSDFVDISLKENIKIIDSLEKFKSILNED